METNPRSYTDNQFDDKFLLMKELCPIDNGQHYIERCPIFKHYRQIKLLS